MTLCLCHSIHATCCVVSIGSSVSLAVEQKPSKDDRNIKLNTLFTNRRSESDLKMEGLADVSYCTQQVHRLCCETLKDWHIHKYTQALITFMAIQRLAERTQKVDPRRLVADLQN